MKRATKQQPVSVRLAGDLAIGPNLASYGLGELLDDEGRGTGFYAWISWKWGEKVAHLEIEGERGELLAGWCVLIERRAAPIHNRACWRPVLKCPEAPAPLGS